MFKKIIAFIACATILPSVYAATQGDTSTSPIEGMEAGKVKRVSKNILPPGLRKVAEEEFEREQKSIDQSTGKRKSNAYEQVAEESLYPKNNYHNHVKPIDERKAEKFKSQPVNLGVSALKDFSYEGFIPEGPTQDGPWSSFTRVFKSPEGLLVMVHEWDFMADGGGIIVIDELMNTDVNGVPARFVKKQTPSGEVFSELSWITKRKEFSITVWANVPETDDTPYNLTWLKEFARKIR